MKILELTRSYYPAIGGLEKFVSDRTKIFDTLELDYTLIASDRFITDKTKLIPNVEYFPTFTSFDIAPTIKKYFKKDYDVLSLNQLGYHFSYKSIVEACRRNWKIVVTPHFLFHTSRFGMIKRIYSKYILTPLIKKIDIMICFTTYEKNFWIKNFNMDERKIRVIPHFINYVTDNTLEKNRHEKYFLYLGRYERNKQIGILLEAFSRLKNCNYKLVLTITKSDLSTFERKFITPDTIFLGKISENRKKQLLSNCTALILPSSYEAFGIVLLEASVYKKPIICSKLPVTQEVLSKEADLFFDNNVDSLTHLLERFIALPEEKKKEVGHINYINLKRFEFEHVLHMYENLFEEIS